MFCLCLCPRICLCVCFCRRICHLQMNPGAVLFSAMYDMWVAMLKSLECGCLSIIGLQRELTEVIYPLCGGYTWWWWKPRLGRHPMGPTIKGTLLNSVNMILQFFLQWERDHCYYWVHTLCSLSVGRTYTARRWNVKSLTDTPCIGMWISRCSLAKNKNLCTSVA